MSGKFDVCTVHGILTNNDINKKGGTLLMNWIILGTIIISGDGRLMTFNVGGG